MIVFQKVSKIYDGCTALNNVDLTIKAKEFISLAGPSGAGKSTLLKLLIGEEKPSKGKLFLDKQNIHLIKENDMPKLRRKIGMVFQDFRLLSDRTAYENVAFAMEVAGATDKEIKQDVPQLLELVGLVDKLNQFPHQLSGGEKQRVAIARTILKRPPIMVFDEATSSLDSQSEQAILNALREIAQGHTSLVIAHRLSTVVDADKIVVMGQGRILEQGTHSQLLALNGAYAALWHTQQRSHSQNTVLDNTHG